MLISSDVVSSFGDISLCDGDKLPDGIHYKNIRNDLKWKKEWTKISYRVKKDVGWKCENCGKDCVNDTKKLHAHEMWLLDYDNRIGEVIYIKALCSYCHHFYHVSLYTINRLNGKIDDEQHLIIQEHLKRYPQEKYKRIISDVNKEKECDINKSKDWIIKPFDNIVKKYLEKRDDNQSDLGF